MFRPLKGATRFCRPPAGHVCVLCFCVCGKRNCLPGCFSASVHLPPSNTHTHTHLPRNIHCCPAHKSHSHKRTEESEAHSGNEKECTEINTHTYTHTHERTDTKQRSRMQHTLVSLRVAVVVVVLFNKLLFRSTRVAQNSQPHRGRGMPRRQGTQAGHCTDTYPSIPAMLPVLRCLYVNCALLLPSHNKFREQLTGAPAVHTHQRCAVPSGHTAIVRARTGRTNVASGCLVFADG